MLSSLTEAASSSSSDASAAISPEVSFAKRSLSKATARKKQLEEHYRPGVERSLKREILLIALAKQEKLDITAEEVGAQIMRLAESDPKNAARVRQHYATADRRKALAESMLEKKALDLIIEAAKTKDEILDPSVELPAAR